MFVRFQYTLAFWCESLTHNPLEVTSVFTLFVASLLSFSTCGASSSCIFRSNAARQQAQGTYWIRYRRYETAESFLTLHILHEDFVSATIQDI